MPAKKHNAQSIQTINICESCVLMLKTAFNVQKVRASLSTKCEHCGKSSSTVASYEVSAKRREAPK